MVLALAHSCIVYEDHCRIGVLSVVFSALVAVVLDSACSADTVLCEGSLITTGMPQLKIRSTYF